MRPMLFLRALIPATVFLTAGPAPAAPVAPVSPARLVTISATQVPARDALDWLSRAGGLRLAPLWQDEDHAESLDPDRPLDLAFDRADPMQALESILESLHDDATWQPDSSGAIEVGPRSRLNRRRSVRVYDIRDLVAQPPNHPHAATIDLESALARSGSVLRDDDRAERRDPAAERADRARALVDLITATVEPEQWADNGGDAGTIRIHESTLVIRAPAYIHRQIAGALLRPSAPSAAK